MSEYTVLSFEARIWRISEGVLHLTTPSNKWKPPLVMESPCWIPHGRKRTIFWTTTVSLFGKTGRRVCVLRPMSDNNGLYMIYLTDETDVIINEIRGHFVIVSEVRIPRVATGSEISFEEVESQFS